MAMWLPARFLVAATFFIGGVFAQGAVELELQQAQEAYKHNAFEDAYKRYELVSPKTPSILYNMGNCAFKQGKLGRALLHWRQAELNWGFTNRRELRENIELAERLLLEKHGGHAQEKPLELKVFKRLQEHVYSLARMVPLLALQLIFLFFWVVLLVYVRFLLKKKRRAIFLGLFCIISVTGALMVFRCGPQLSVRGIVISQEAAVYSGPGTNYQRIGLLHEGDQVTVKAEIDAFCKIKSGKYLGWVEREAIGTV